MHLLIVLHSQRFPQYSFAKMSKVRRVLIVGAGASGLPAIKCCLDDGLEPVCLERSGDVGGLWNYENSLSGGDDIACVMKSTIINTSKEMMCYSDFPIPEEFPNFMHNTLVQQYLCMYADTFKLRKCIQLNTEVRKMHYSFVIQLKLSPIQVKMFLPHNPHSLCTMTSAKGLREADRINFSYVRSCFSDLIAWSITLCGPMCIVSAHHVSQMFKHRDTSVVCPTKLKKNLVKFNAPKNS
jgi:Flavin-binding monooxygenase-like